jgi:hypothetical protein
MKFIVAQGYPKNLGLALATTWMKVSKGVIGEFSFNNYFLLALDEQKREIKFISGQFFRNPISSDFNLDFNNPNSFIEYLRLKTFYLQTKDFVFVKRKG